MSSALWVTVRDLGPQWESSDYAAEAVKAASHIMWALSGRRYSGTQTVTERYVRFAPLINTRLIQEAAIVNSRINKALAIVEPWVSAETRIRLRGQPVSQIVTVRNVNGGIVPVDNYYLVDHSTIQFSDGALIVPADIEITYSYGSEPPTLGKMAARRIAIEFVKLWEGDSDCALPQRVTSVTRQGVSYTVLDSQDFLEEMRLGIYEVDLFLKTVNPNKAQKRSKVFSPDIPKARKYTPKPLTFTGPTAVTIPVTKAGSGEYAFTLSSLDAQFLYSEPGWVPELIIRSYGGAKFKVIDPAVIEVTSTTVSFSIEYSDAVSVLKLADPGTWDLYASKNGTTVHIVSGNLTIDVTA